MNEVKIGTYKHFKGFICKVLGVAKHSETLEEVVVYEHDDKMWIRPKKMFLESVEFEGKKVPRFEFIE